MARMILFVAVFAAVALASQAANLRTAGDATQWTEKKNFNIDDEDFGACNLAMGKDIRTNPAKVAACKATCDKKAGCKAIVFHKWGVMMKKGVTSLKATSSKTDYTTYV